MEHPGLDDLPNVGAVLVRELNEIGVHTYADLKRMGSLKAGLNIAAHGRKDCHSMLCALEGAIRGVRWHTIPKEERKRLSDAFDRQWDKQKG